jgi:hypothetical protein
MEDPLHLEQGRSALCQDLKKAWSKTWGRTPWDDLILSTRLAAAQGTNAIANPWAVRDSYGSKAAYAIGPDGWNSGHVPQVGTGPVDGPDREDSHPFQVESSPQREYPHRSPNQVTKSRALPGSPEPAALSHSPRPFQSVPYTTPPLEKSDSGSSTFDAGAPEKTVCQAGLKHSAVSEQVKHRTPNTELERGKSTDPQNTAREDGNSIEKQGPTIGMLTGGPPSSSVEASTPVDSSKNSRPGESQSDVKTVEVEKVGTLKAGSSSIGSGETGALENGREAGNTMEKDVGRVLEMMGAASPSGRNGAKDAPGKADGDERETGNTMGKVKGSAVRPEEDSTSKKDADGAGVGRGHGTAGEIGGADRKNLRPGAGNKGEREGEKAVGMSVAASQSGARAITGGQSDVLPVSRKTGEGSTANASERSVAASQKSEGGVLGGSDAQPSAGRVPDVNKRGARNAAQDVKEEGRSSTFKLNDLSSPEPVTMKGTAGTAALEKGAQNNAMKSAQPSGDGIESPFKGNGSLAGTTSKEEKERGVLLKPAGLETASGLQKGEAPPGTRVKLADLKPTEGPLEDGARDVRSSAAKASLPSKPVKVEETSLPGPLSGMAKGAFSSPVGVEAGDASAKPTEGEKGAGVRPGGDAISNGAGRPEGSGSKAAESAAPLRASAVKNGDEAFRVGTAKLPDGSAVERVRSGPNVVLTGVSTGEKSKPVKTDETPLPKPKNGDDAASPSARAAVGSSDNEKGKGGQGSSSSGAMGASKAGRSEDTPPAKPGTGVKNRDDMPASPIATRAAELSNSVQQKTGTPRK